MMARAVAMVLAVMLAAPSVLAQSPYDETVARASALEAAGRFTEAAGALAPLVERYPQDYALQLQLAWLRFQAGDYRAAETHYREAAALSGGGREAQLGLGWSLLREGDYEAAGTELRAVLEAHPDDASAREGLDLAEAATSADGWTIWSGFFYHLYGDHPDVTRGWTVAGGVEGRAFDHVLLAATYRYSRYVLETTETVQGQAQGQGPGARQGTQTAALRIETDRHQVYLAAGAVFEGFGAAAHYGRLVSGDEGDADVLGLTARVSPWGDLGLEASVDLYPDTTVVRVAPSWALPATDFLTLRPGAALQVEDGETRWSGSLTATLHGGPGALWLGAKWGEEERLIVLGTAAAYDIAGVTRFGAWLGAELELGDWRPFASWELAGVDAPGDGVERADVVHWFGLGVGRRF